MATVILPAEARRDHLPVLLQAAKAAQESGEYEIVVDMSSIKQICSADLNELMKAHLELQDQGRKLVLVNTLEPLTQVFAITRFDRVIDVRASSHA